MSSQVHLFCSDIFYRCFGMGKPKIFISYSWDDEKHKKLVKEKIADKLKENQSFEIIFDDYLVSTPKGGLKEWMQKQVENADLIIVVCTKRYYDFFENNIGPTEGRGVRWESRFIKNEIYDSNKDISLFFPIIFNQNDEQYIPKIFYTDCHRYNIANNEFEKLKAALLDKWNKIYKNENRKYDIKKSPETIKIKNLLKNTNIELFHKIIYPYLPEIYLGKLPENVDETIDKLLGIGKLKDDQLPILCIFKELNQKNYNEKIENYIKYLKDYWNIQKENCPKNKTLSEFSLIVEIDTQDGKEDFYNIRTWKYANAKIEEQTDLGASNDKINNFLDEAFKYLERIKVIYDYICFEIILPDEIIYKGIKDWHDSKGLELIRKYRYVLRLRSRFLQPKKDWEINWKKLKENSSYLLSSEKLCKNIKNKVYNKELSNAYCISILEQKIENHKEFFNDIEEFGIPIVLSPLSDEYVIDNKLKKETIKDCKNVISDYIMRHQASDFLFIYDDPNKIPDNFKKPEENLWGY